MCKIFTWFDCLATGGMVFASKMNDSQFVHPLPNGANGMNSSQNQSEKRAESTTSLETIIAVGLFGWLALSMTLMGLGIW